MWRPLSFTCSVVIDSHFVSICHFEQVTVFDFSMIMERTEKRVERDLLGSGPKSVEELRAIRVRLKQRYRAQLDKTKQRAEQQIQKQEQQQRQEEEQAAEESAAATATDAGRNDVETKPGGIAGISLQDSRKVAGQVVSRATNVATGATTIAAGVFAKIKSPISPGFNPLRRAEDGSGGEPQVEPEQKGETPQLEPDLIAFSASDEDGDGDWVQSPAVPPTDAIEHFSIDDDDDML